MVPDRTHTLFDVVSDQSGATVVGLLRPDGNPELVPDGVGALTSWARSDPGSLACLDLRQFSLLGLPLPSCERTVDLTLANGGPERARAALSPDVRERSREAARALAASLRSFRAAGVDTSRRSFLRTLAPRWAVEGYLRARLGCAEALLARASLGGPGWTDAYASLGRTASRLYSIEAGGVSVDVGLARELVRTGSGTPAQLSALRSIVSLERGGRVFTRFNPAGGRTGRYRVLDGFNCMSLPKGGPRRCVVPSHPGGHLAVIDFNAIDYRCIVASVPDPAFRALYEGCPDFHARTTSFLFGESGVDELRRKVLKDVTYRHLYGGSEQTLSEATGLSAARLRQVLARLDRVLAPVARLRESLYATSRRDGHVTLPDGTRVPVGPDDHPGKVLGLYAQTYSSRVFDAAFVAAVDLLAGSRTRALFTVHDELVLDVHPDEGELVETTADAMVAAAGPMHAVKVRRGVNYEDAH